MGLTRVELFSIFQVNFAEFFGWAKDFILYFILKTKQINPDFDFITEFISAAHITILSQSNWRRYIYIYIYIYVLKNTWYIFLNFNNKFSERNENQHFIVTFRILLLFQTIKIHNILSLHNKILINLFYQIAIKVNNYVLIILSTFVV